MKNGRIGSRMRASSALWFTLLLSAACESGSGAPAAEQSPSSGDSQAPPMSDMGLAAAGTSGGAAGQGSQTPGSGMNSGSGSVGTDNPSAGMSGGADQGAAGANGSAAGAPGGDEPAAGTGGDEPVAGASGQGEAGGDAAPALRPRCKTRPEQVIVVGDSYINWITHTFPQDLAREAGETWRMYAVGGCSLGSGGLCLVPDQLDQAIDEDSDIIASVMTGGGNDILIADEFRFPGGNACKDRADSASVPVCQQIVATAIEAGEALMQRAADAGIRDVIYMFYPHIPGGGFGGMNPNYLLDYALPMARALCDEAEQRTEGKLRCHFLDLVPVFEGHPEWFADDGIHQNSMGSAAMAREVVELARERCIAQPASSGCCEG